MASSTFHPLVQAWFARSFERPTRAQSLGWASISTRRSTLILAPTGSGKTLAAFLAAIDRLMFEPVPADPLARLRVLYVSPLKALAIDIERNLRAPLVGIAGHAARDKTAMHTPVVEVRTGDTSAATRARIARTPPDILITTPESLYLMLTAQSREVLGSVDVLIIDEIHSLVPSKRGAHLMLSIERLEELRARMRENPPALQRIGLSATQRPLDEVARFLGGRGDDGAWRPVSIVDARERKIFDLRVEVPVEDMSKLGELDDIPSGPAAGAPMRRSIWPSIHPRLLELIRAHRSTIVFVNSRRLAERLAAAINELATSKHVVAAGMGTLARIGRAPAAAAPALEGPTGPAVEIALAHHGSVAREKRSEIEDRLKRGALPCIVATSSLELGIDMGAVDLVVQIEAPPSVASAVQRIGRAGHSVGTVSRGVVFPKHRGDLLPIATVAARVRSDEGVLVEETFYPRNPLDVLAQQVVAIAASHAPVVRKKATRRTRKRPEHRELAVEALFDLVRRAAPFAELPRGSFDGVLDMLSGRYLSDDFAGLRARITWDRVAGTIRAREGALRLAILNGGTITDRGLYGVFLAGGGTGEGSKSGSRAPSRRVGELDEEMVFESRIGDVFLLGATSWRIEEITRDQVIVTPAPGEPGKMPFWHGDRAGRPSEFGRAVGALTRELAEAPRAKATRRVIDDLGFDARAAQNLFQYLDDQREAAGALPTDRAIVVERFVDDVGDWRVCILSPLGARIHAPWSTAVAARLRHTFGEIDSMWGDDGIAFRIPESDAPPDPMLFFPASDEVEELVTSSLGGTSLFAARFRECAARALLLPRRTPLKRTPLWAQRRRSADLLAVAARHPSFPILLETYRECLRDVFDLPGLVDTLRQVELRALRVVTVDTRNPSPFAASLLFAYVASFIYDGDTPLAERKAQALGVDYAQLRELLGEAELRELLDPESIEEHERVLQRIPDEALGVRPVKSADGVHDLLLSIGDLSTDELRQRFQPPNALEETLIALERERRVVRIAIVKSKRYIAAEDAGRFRDALGVVPVAGLPGAFLEPVADPLGDLVARFARTHGPFTTEAVSARFGLSRGAVEDVLGRLAQAPPPRTVVAGEFLRGGRSREWCDAEVLRALRRKSLARLRQEVEPVDPAAYGRFLPEWQRVPPLRDVATSDPATIAAASRSTPHATNGRASLEALLTAIEQLQGAPIPASVLEAEVLPARVPDYRPGDLDALVAAGEVVWGGVEPIGPNDGRVALYLAEHEPLLVRAVAPAEGELVARIRDLLSRRGAIFFAEIAREIPGYPGETVEGLWSLVWSGEVTNDTLAPLRSRLYAGQSTRRATTRGRFLGPPGSEGRWSLRSTRWARAPTETERRTALARTLLDRYGVLTREAVHAEGVASGFSAVYDVLKAMEEAGRVRRGYFIAGRGATQFALPGADERLRAQRSATAREEQVPTWVLAATDPANAYGAAIPWPERAPSGLGAAASSTADGHEPPPGVGASNGTGDRARPQRAVGASVVLHGGAIIGWLGRSEHTLTTFLPSDEPGRSDAMRALAAALARTVETGRRRLLLLSEIDGAPVADSPLAPFLAAAGFVAGARGWLRRKRVTTPLVGSRGA